jgi:cellulose synthase/poly-beta-1,6-N-acetylglucosamine synthase-like glycosyltransferase
MSTVTAIGGFDKEIELKMLRAGYKIFYLNNALVYDEKVQKAEVFSNQRRRWLSAQLHYFRTDFLSSLKDLLLKGNFDYFDKAIQFIQPPRILLLGGLLVLGAIFTVINVMMDNGATYTYIWSAITGGCILAFLLAIPGSFYNFQTAKAVLSLPKGMLLMFGSLLKIKGANKKFLHTQHTSTTLNS